MRAGRASGCRGAALVELAMVLPLLALLAFGALEMGLAWRDRLTVQTATRAGVRVGSAEGRLATADQGVLLAVGAALHDLGLGDVDWVVVYKSDTSDGSVPSACTTPVPQSVSGSCNAYTGAQLQEVVEGTAPSSWFGCGGSSLDGYWCPASRQSVQALGPDFLGVWIRAGHPMLTGLFESELTVEDDAVMRLEPQEASA